VHFQSFLRFWRVFTYRIYWIEKVGGRGRKESLWDGVGIEVRGEFDVVGGLGSHVVGLGGRPVAGVGGVAVVGYFERFVVIRRNYGLTRSGKKIESGKYFFMRVLGKLLIYCESFGLGI